MSLPRHPPRRPSRHRRLAALAPIGAALALAGASALAQTAPSTVPAGQPLDYDQAWQRLQDRSDRLAAARAAVEGKQMQRQGLAGLGGPVVSVAGAAYTYNANLDISLDPLKQRIGLFSQALPTPLQGLLAATPLPQLPSKYTLERRDSATTASLAAVWPIYAGGASQAARGFLEAQAREAQADSDKTGDELGTLLAQRYFGAQLAARAAALRAAAERTIGEHDAAAARMLAAGVISRVERLQAQAAYEDARRNAMKARDDAELAAVALARLVKAEGTVAPQTPLFVLSQPVEPLQHFVDAALQHHPGLSKVAAKKSQAEQLHAGEEALRKPQVFAFGTRELRTGTADWVAGVGVRWTLYDSVDRNALAAASLKQVEQAERTDAQARSDIALLVEKNWRALEQARRQFLATGPGIALSQEVLKLRAAGLREGTSTALELIDAETNQAKALTERAQAAYEYVQALAQLLESTGQADQFAAYLRRADVKVE